VLKSHAFLIANKGPSTSVLTRQIHHRCWMKSSWTREKVVAIIGAHGVGKMARVSVGKTAGSLTSTEFCESRAPWGRTNCRYLPPRGRASVRRQLDRRPSLMLSRGYFVGYSFLSRRRALWLPAPTVGTGTPQAGFVSLRHSVSTQVDGQEIDSFPVSIPSHTAGRGHGKLI
jgi:hypothetical protein